MNVNFKRSYSKHRYNDSVEVEEERFFSFTSAPALASKQGFCPTDLFISAQSDEKPYFGAHGDEEIPVPIPNTEVKLVSGDYTATSGKLARCRIIQ